MDSAIRSVGIIIVFNIMILFTVLAIHEIGHYLVGLQSGCDSAKVVLLDTTEEGPYTELHCSEGVNLTLPYAASLGFTLVFGGLFLFFKPPERNLFLVIVGLSILTAGLDVVMLTNIEFLQYIFIFVGLVFVALGEIVFGISFFRKSL